MSFLTLTIKLCKCHSSKLKYTNGLYYNPLFACITTVFINKIGEPKQTPKIASQTTKNK